MSTPHTTSDVVADLWSRAIERAEGEPRADMPTAFSTEARWAAVIARVDATVETIGPPAPQRAAMPSAPIAPTSTAGRWWE